jgi:hypothetical protein
MNVQPITSAFKNIFSSNITSQQQRTLLGVASGGNLFLEEGGFFSKALNIAGIASIFCPALLLPVAIAYLAKGALQIGKGLVCLASLDFGGFLSNTLAGGINAICALPFGKLANLKGAFNSLKAGEVGTGAFLARVTRECYGNQAARQLISATRTTQQIQKAPGQAFENLVRNGRSGLRDFWARTAPLAAA